MPCDDGSVERESLAEIAVRLADTIGRPVDELMAELTRIALTGKVNE